LGEDVHLRRVSLHCETLLEMRVLRVAVILLVEYLNEIGRHALSPIGHTGGVDIGMVVVENRAQLCQFADIECEAEELLTVVRASGRVHELKSNNE
ncbi:hypothetical protein PMAYCL1PPCAC_22007, partial [Pristionchus mayeri]